MARYTKKDLVEDLLLHDLLSDQPKYKVQQLVEDIFDKIADKVVLGDDVAIAGFGKFENYTRTNGVNTPKFRPAKALKDKVSA